MAKERKWASECQLEGVEIVAGLQQKIKLAKEIEMEMRERSTEIMVRRADVLHDILELEKKMKRNG